MFRSTNGSEVNFFDLWISDQGMNEDNAALQTVNATVPGVYKSSLLVTSLTTIYKVFCIAIF